MSDRSLTAHADALTVPPEISRDFDEPRRWWLQSKLHLKASGACAIFTGLCLLDLKKKYGIRAGRPSKAGNSAVQCGISWEALVEREMGFGETWARQLMMMAEGQKNKVAELRDILPSKPVIELTADEQGILCSNIHRIFPKETTTQLMLDLDMTKRDPGPKNGSSPNPAGRPKGTTDERTLDEKAQATVWPAMLALGELTEHASLDAYLRVLPLQPDTEAGRLAALEPLCTVLETALHSVKRAIAEQRKGAGA